jgi:hypothetical protein
MQGAALPEMDMYFSLKKPDMGNIAPGKPPFCNKKGPIAS